MLRIGLAAGDDAPATDRSSLAPLASTHFRWFGMVSRIIAYDPFAFSTGPPGCGGDPIGRISVDWCIQPLGAMTAVGWWSSRVVLLRHVKGYCSKLQTKRTTLFRCGRDPLATHGHDLWHAGDKKRRTAKTPLLFT